MVGRNKGGEPRFQARPSCLKPTMKRRITRTVIETREIIRVTLEEPPTVADCPVCGRETPFLRPEAAAGEAGISQRELFRRIESGAIHHLELPDGGVLICSHSLTGPPARTVSDG